MLLLLDIDGTLVKTGGVGRRCLAEAFERVLGVRGAMDGIRLQGNTDPAIVDEAFGLHVQRPMKPDERTALFETYYVLLEAELAEDRSRYEVLPGAKEITEAALEAGWEVGLATGNMEKSARIKLAPAGLDVLYAFGGFGSDAKDRGELVSTGIRRGQDRFERRGSHAPREAIFVVGDTERDVVAARAANAVAVGVIAGSGCVDALRAARPDLLVDSLLSESLWSAFGLSA